MMATDHECEETHCVICCPRAQGYTEGFDAGRSYTSMMLKIRENDKPIVLDELFWTGVGLGLACIALGVFLDRMDKVGS